MYKRGINPGTKNVKEINFKSELQEELGEIIGAFAGDGNFYFKRDGGYRTMLFLNETEHAYAKHLKNIIRRTFDVNPRLWRYEKGNMIYLIMHRKRVYEAIKEYLIWESKNKTYTVHLSRSLESYGPKFIKGFLKGLISTDGSVSYKATGRGRLTIQFCTSSKNLLDQYNSGLAFFGIDYISYKRDNHGNTMWATEFSKKSMIKKFYDNVGLNEARRRDKLQKFIKNNLAREGIEPSSSA